MTYIKINAARTHHNTRTIDGKPSTKYSPYETGLIVGEERSVMAVIADSAGFDGLGFDTSVGASDDSWHVLNTYKMGQYVDTIAIGGAMDAQHAVDIAKTQLDHLGAHTCTLITGSTAQFDSMSDQGNTWSIDAISKLMNNPSQDKPFLPMITGAELNHESSRVCFDSVEWNEGATLLSHKGAGSRLHLDMVRTDTRRELFEPFSLSEELARLDAKPMDEASFDALMESQNHLDRLKDRLVRAMRAAGTDDLTVENVDQTKPFKRLGLMNIAFVFNLTDGQSISIWFHNPDSTPNKLLPSDIMISWKWMLNKRDVTAVLSPKQGDNVQLPVLAKRMLMLAGKNSKRFKSTQARVAKDAQDLLDAQALVEAKNAEIAQLDADISDLNKKIDAAMKAPKADAVIAPTVTDMPAIDDTVDAYEVDGVVNELNNNYSTGNEIWGRSIAYVQNLTDDQFHRLENGLTEANYHSENIVLRAKRTGVFEYIAEAEALLQAHENEGSITQDIMTRRTELYKKIDQYWLDAKSAVAADIDDSTIVAASPITLTGDEIDVGEGVDFKTAKNNAMAYFDKNLRDKVIFCPAIDSDVLLRRRGGKHIAKSNNTFRDKLQLVAAIPEMIKQGKYSSYTQLDKEKGSNIEGYFVLKVDVIIGDASRAARVVLEKNNEGEVLYDIGIDKKEALAALGDTTSNITFDGFTGSSQYQDFLEQDYQENDDQVNQFDKLSTQNMVLNIFFDDDDSENEADETKTTDDNAVNNKVTEGRANESTTVKGTKVSSSFALVEAKNLITSHNAQGVANSNFPQELQPRDRSDKKSVESIAANAKNLEPEKLGDTEFAGNGAPIVGDDLIVESGNGRAIAIKLAYDNDDASNYKEWLASNADSFGLSAEEVNSYDQPVLVRIRKSKIDRISFAIEANLDANDKYLNDNADEMPQPTDQVIVENAPTLDDSLAKRLDEIQAIINADTFSAEDIDPAELEDLMAQSESDEILSAQTDAILDAYQNKLIAISMVALSAMTGGA